jgi:putative peptidoglycan lipid II flippase
MASSRALNNSQILRAALVVLFGFLASGVTGFIRLLIIAQQFSTGEALDAFFAAQRIPEMIFVLVAGGALGSSFIPIYARQRHLDEAQAWRLASAVMTLSALAAALLGGLIALAAPFLVATILLPESAPEVQHLTANLMQLMMITPFIFSISGLIMGILQSHGLFLLPSVAISMNNIGLIVGAIVIAPALSPAEGVAQVGANNIYGLAYGAVLSALLHLVVQLPGLVQIRAKLRFLPDINLPGVLEVLKLMLPRVLGLAVVQINFLVNIILTDGMKAGSLAALNIAFQLMFFALGIIGQSVGSAVFPTLAALYAENDMTAFRARLSLAMRSVLFLAIPATVVFIILGQPIVSIFERGEWTLESTAATAWALAFYAIGLAGFALLEVLSRAFYALADTWTPVSIGIAAMVSNIAMSLILVRVIGSPESLAQGAFGGLALANALTTLIEALILWGLMQRRIGGSDKKMSQTLLRTILAAGIMGVVLGLIANIFVGNTVLILGASGIMGGAVFFASAWILRLEEAHTLLTPILRRVRRGSGGEQP